jgi:hypothetical protein
LSPVPGVAFDLDEAVVFELTEQAADVTGVEVERRTQVGDPRSIAAISNSTRDGPRARPVPRYDSSRTPMRLV